MPARIWMTLMLVLKKLRNFSEKAQMKSERRVKKFLSTGKSRLYKKGGLYVIYK